MRRIPGIRRVFRLPESAVSVEADIDEELRFHLESRVEVLVAGGMSPEVARAQALREFGDVAAARRELAAIDRRRRGRARWVRWGDDLVRDARFALRGLARTRGFTVAAVLTLAVGVGVNAVVFGAVERVLLRPLPFADAGRLVLLWETFQDLPEINVSHADYLDWRARSRVFSRLAAFDAHESATLTGVGDPERLAVGWATADLLPTLGVSPVLGRAFTAADDARGAPPVALLSWGFWQRRFGGDPGVLGRTLTLDGRPTTVIGVLPRRFRIFQAQDLWLAFSAVADSTAFLRQYHSLAVVGRLRPGATLETARRDMARVARELATEHPRENASIGVGMAALAALLAGLAPALQGARAALAGALRERGATGGRRRVRARTVLIAAEVALSLVLLIGAALVIGSLVRLVRVDPGFDAHDVLVVEVALPRSRYPDDERRRVFFRELLARFGSAPGVESAALVDPLPFGPHGWQTSMMVEGQILPEGKDGPLVDASLVSPDYFHTLRIPIKRGRPFSAADRVGAPPVALVSETFARRYWPGQDPVGKRMLQGKDEPWIQVVGVVGDVRRGSLAEPPRAEVYFPDGQRAPASATVAVRTRGEPLAAVPMLRRQLATLDPDLPLYGIASLEQRVDASVAGRRFAVVLLAIAGAVALVLALGGIYAVIAGVVAGSRREIGVRMALGARPASVVARIVAQGMRPVALGLAAGIVAALALSRTLSSLLFGVGRHDPLTFALATAVLALVAALAIYVPARRATRIDPVMALRAD